MRKFSSSFEKMVPNGDGTVRWEFDEAKARERFQDATVDGNGVVRWKSNNSVPPTDILEDWARLGLPFDLEASKAARDGDLDKFFKEYRRAQRNRKPSAEEMFELRANFEPGTVVVDVITGRKIRV